MTISITLHVLAAIIWVGGMFFAYMALRPAALTLEPAARLPLWSRTFARFFPWVWVAVILLPLTGYAMIFLGFGGFAQAGKYIHIMHATGMAMIVIFVYVFLAPYRRLKKTLAVSDLAAAGEQLARIRRLIGINLTLGLVTTIIGTSGAYWLN